MGHGENPSLSVKGRNVQLGIRSAITHAKGQFKSRCYKNGFKVESVKVQVEKDMVCSVGMTGVATKQMTQQYI